MKPRSLGQALRRSTTRRKRVRASIRRKPEERADPDLDLDVDQQSGSRCRPLRRYRHTRRVRGSRRAGSSGVARRLHWRSRRSTSGSVRAARCVAGTSLGRCRSRRTGSTTLRSRVLRTTPQAWAGRSRQGAGTEWKEPTSRPFWHRPSTTLRALRIPARTGTAALHRCPSCAPDNPVHQLNPASPDGRQSRRRVVLFVHDGGTAGSGCGSVRDGGRRPSGL